MKTPREQVAAVIEQRLKHARDTNVYDMHISFDGFNSGGFDRDQIEHELHVCGFRRVLVCRDCVNVAFELPRVKKVPIRAPPPYEM